MQALKTMFRTSSNLKTVSCQNGPMTALYERIMLVRTHGACSYVTYMTATRVIRAKTQKNDEMRPVRRLLRVRTAAAKV